MSEETSSTKKNRASIKAIARYNKANYDRIAVVVPKGSAEAIKAAAASENKSTNRYILEAIEAKSGLRLAMDSARSFAAVAAVFVLLIAGFILARSFSGGSSDTLAAVVSFPLL